MLILFDIDNTLLTSRGVGRRAMHEAVCELFGENMRFDGVEIAGRLDRLIFRDLASINGFEDTEEHHEQFRRIYRRVFTRLLGDGDPIVRLPGVEALVDELHEREDVTIGLLTGNYPETGRMKVEAAELNPDVFKVCAWGDRGDSRRDLPPRAIAEHEAVMGSPIEPARVVIIGDTPHDVDCAAHHGCRCLAVATGSFDLKTLQDCGADQVVADLTETTAIVNWIVTGEAVSNLA